MAVRFIVRVIILLSFLACPITASPADGVPREFTARVIAVADGDSFTVTDSFQRSYRIRLQGIDAPERGQPFSAISRRTLRDRVFGRDVVVVPQKLDRHGRIVATVRAGGRDVALEQLRFGFAWFYADYQSEMSFADRTDYAAAQRMAKLSGSGLWSAASPVPPWRFRRARGFRKIPANP